MTMAMEAVDQTSSSGGEELQQRVQTLASQYVGGHSSGSGGLARTALFAGRNCARERERGRERPPGFASSVAPGATRRVVHAPVAQRPRRSYLHSNVRAHLADVQHVFWSRIERVSATPTWYRSTGAAITPLVWSCARRRQCLGAARRPCGLRALTAPARSSDLAFT